jgi:tetratricopeptide (TPR) repeat protein
METTAKPNHCTNAPCIREKVLGKEHPLVATSLNNLAVLYSAQGNYSQAEPLYQRSLAISEKVLGQGASRCAQQVFNNLAGLYKIWVKYSQAEPNVPTLLATLGRKCWDKRASHCRTKVSTIWLSCIGYRGTTAKLNHCTNALGDSREVLEPEHPMMPKVSTIGQRLYRDMRTTAKLNHCTNAPWAIWRECWGRASQCCY